MDVRGLKSKYPASGSDVSPIMQKRHEHNKNKQPRLAPLRGATEGGALVFCFFLCVFLHIWANVRVLDVRSKYLDVNPRMSTTSRPPAQAC